MNKVVYRTMTKDRKNHVILSHDTEKDMYYVSYKFYGNSDRFSYTHWNYATFKFDTIHKKFLEEFKENVLTNLR